METSLIKTPTVHLLCPIPHFLTCLVTQPQNGLRAVMCSYSNLLLPIVYLLLGEQLFLLFLLKCNCGGSWLCVCLCLCVCVPVTSCFTLAVSCLCAPCVLLLLLFEGISSRVLCLVCFLCLIMVIRVICVTHVRSFPHYPSMYLCQSLP